MSTFVFGIIITVNNPRVIAAICLKGIYDVNVGRHLIESSSYVGTNDSIPLNKKQDLTIPIAVSIFGLLKNIQVMQTKKKTREL